MRTEKIKREPLIHITKRSVMPTGKAVLVRVIAVAAALVFCAVIIMVLTGKNPIRIYGSMLSGAFGTPRRIWNLAQGMAILLCISLAVTPAFKMKFWNIGAEGQALIGCLAAATCMVLIGDNIPKPLLLVIMTVASVVAGAIWAVIPAVFKAKWNTNETLFTLMMNYIATQLVSFAVKTWAKDGSGVLQPMPQFGFPKLFGKAYLMNILVVIALTAFLYIYLKYSKHGYEIAVVGESENTARYIGINVKQVIIRTMILSGAICGLAGLLLTGGTDHTVSTATVGGRGFTAIMVSWLGKFNPLTMILTTFLIVFLEKGAGQISTDFRLDTSISDIVTAIILLFIIGCEFFINYKINFRRSKKEEVR